MRALKTCLLISALMLSFLILGCSTPQADKLTLTKSSKYMTSHIKKYHCPAKTVRGLKVCNLRLNAKAEQNRRIANARGRHIANRDKIKGGK